MARPGGAVTRRLAAMAVLAAVFASDAAAATRYDPRLRFRTIATARFDIHFHQGEDALARRLARIAEAVAATLDRTLGPADGRVQVILVDQADVPNGWATPLPYNTIEITAAPPTGESLIGNTEDWLRLVFTHEYTHIVQLSRAGGWIGGLRRVFGRLPLLFPNLAQPLWAIEGLATWEESSPTDGRLRAGDFRQILDRAVAVGQFEPIDRANGGLLDWPSGHTPYLYGGFFHQYLAQRYGGDSIRRLTDETARRVPYFGWRAYKKVFGRSLGDLWTDFEADAARAARDADSGAAIRLTRHGFSVSSPRFAPDGRLYYSIANPHGFPSLMELAPGRAPRRVTTKYLGKGIGFAGSRLIFDQLETVANVALQSDLWMFDREAGSTVRLTREARAADPDVSPDGLTIVCVVLETDRRGLSTITWTRPGETLAAPMSLASEPGMHYASPRWSPDGRWIAAERRRQRRGPSEIVLVDASTGAVRVVAATRPGRSVSPAWMPGGRAVLFASDAEGGPFRIYRVDLETLDVSRLEKIGPSAESPAVSPDGRTLAFVGYTPDGYDVFAVPLASAVWSPVAADLFRARPADAEPEPSLDAEPVLRPYAPRRTLLPRFWTPTLESDQDELVFGAATGSLDVLGRHAYGVEAGWASSRARPDWQAAYAYDRWWPTLFLAASDDTDPWRAGEIRTTEIDAGVLLPVRRVRWSHVTFGSFNTSVDRADCPACDPPVVARARRRSLRGGWSLTTARAFGYSIGPEEGGSLTVTSEVTPEGFGSDGNGGAATLDVRRYLGTWPAHGVLALRGAAALSWGDRAVARTFTAAGNGPQPGGFGFGSDAIGLLRGFDEGEVSGTRAAVLNADYRVPLARIERGAGTFPLFLRTIHGAMFVDAGHAWSGRFRARDARIAAGVELSVDTVVGYALPLTFTAGAAWRVDGSGGDRGVVAFGRVGRAF